MRRSMVLGWALAVLVACSLVVSCGSKEVTTTNLPDSAPALVKVSPDAKLAVVYMNGKKADTYHRGDCAELDPQKADRFARAIAESSGAKPCTKCNP